MGSDEAFDRKQAPAPDPEPVDFEEADAIAHIWLMQTDGGVPSLVLPDVMALARAYLALRVVPASGPEEKLWCEECEGSGEVDAPGGPNDLYDVVAKPCADCGGKGYLAARPAVPASEERELSDEAIEREWDLSGYIVHRFARAIWDRALASPAAAPREVTEGEVEAAAQALWDGGCLPRHTSPDDTLDEFRALARRILTAAIREAPHV